MTNIEAVVNKEVEKAPTYLYGLFDDNVFSQFVAFFYYIPTPPIGPSLIIYCIFQLSNNIP